MSEYPSYLVLCIFVYHFIFATTPSPLPPHLAPPRRCHMRGRSVIYAPRLKVRNIFPYKGVAIQGKFHCDVTAPTPSVPSHTHPPHLPTLPRFNTSSPSSHPLPPTPNHPTMSTLSAKNVESTARQRGHSAMVCCPGSHQPYSTFVLELTTSFSRLFTLIPTYALEHRTSNPLPPVSPPRP